MPSIVQVYPFDPTGNLASNLIQNEQQIVTAVNYRDYHLVVPRFAPFFLESMVATITEPDTDPRPLVRGIDYWGVFQFISASRACSQPVWGGIALLDNTLSGVIKLSYQTLGGEWTLDEQGIAELLAYSLHNPRVTAWEQVIGLPHAFPVIDHEWDLVDLVGASEIVDSLTAIEAAIRASGGADITAHINNFNNPHQTTKDQVQLGLVMNYATATNADVDAGTADDLYMTVAKTKRMITGPGGPNAALAAHIAERNPHGTQAHDVDAFTQAEVTALLVNKLGVTGTAADSLKFNGRSDTEYRDWALETGVAANSILFNGLDIDGVAAEVLQGTAADTDKVGGKTQSEFATWVLTQNGAAANSDKLEGQSLAQVLAMAAGGGGSGGAPQHFYPITRGEAVGTYWTELAQIIVPPVSEDDVPGYSDINLLLTGGDANGAVASPFWAININIRGTSPQVAIDVVTLNKISGASQIGWTIEDVDPGSGTPVPTLRLWLQTAQNINSTSITNVSSAAVKFIDDNRVNVSPVGITLVETDTMARESEISTLLTNVTTRLEELTAAITGA